MELISYTTGIIFIILAEIVYVLMVKKGVHEIKKCPEKHSTRYTQSDKLTGLKIIALSISALITSLFWCAGYVVKYLINNFELEEFIYVLGQITIFASWIIGVFLFFYINVKIGKRLIKKRKRK